MYNTDVADGVIPPTVTQLTCYFLRLGAIGFGGPVALAARMHRELVEERGWVGQQEYLEGLAFAQLAPGPLAAQLAMYLGFTRRGAVGCTAAGAAFVLPSFLAVLAIASAYRTYGGLPLVRSLFYGIGPAAIGVMAIAAGRLAAKTIRGDRVLLALFGVAALWTSMAQQEVLAVFVAAGVVNAAVRTGRTGGLAPHAPLVLGATPTAGATTLFAFFAKAGLFVFGSGLAIVPFLYRGVVVERHWLTDGQFVDAIAVAMITPGPVVITVAFIGFLVAGLSGAVAAAAGIFAPVYVMVLVVAPLFRHWSGHPTVRAFVAGVTAAAAGAIAGATVVLGGRTIHDVPGSLITAASLLLGWRRWPEPAIVAAAAAAGLVLATPR